MMKVMMYMAGGLGLDLLLMPFLLWGLGLTQRISPAAVIAGALLLALAARMEEKGEEERE